MFNKIAFVLLSILLSGVVQGTFTEDFTTYVETSVANLLGINCLAETVLSLEDAADEFFYQIKKNCGQAADLETELADTKGLMRLTKKVLDINDEICNNSGYDDEIDASKQPKLRCAENLKYYMAKLLTSFVQTQQDIDTGLKATYSSSACVKMAMTNFKYILTNFGPLIGTCAELADQV